VIVAACEPASGFSAGNFALLERLFPGLAEEIRGGGVLAPEDICVNKTPSGEPALIVKNSHVHSPRDPVRESRRLVEASLAEANPAGEGDRKSVV
jgi:hypothetical protein